MAPKGKIHEEHKEVEILTAKDKVDIMIDDLMNKIFKGLK